MSKVKRFSLEERYGYQNRKVIYDKDADNDIELNSIYPIIDLLNKYDKQIAELKKQLDKHNKYFNSLGCDNFDEFTDFISSFMLTPHEEQILIKDLEAKLAESEADKKALISDYESRITKHQELMSWLEHDNGQLKQQLKESESKRKSLEEKVKWLSEENEECFIDGQKYNELSEQKDKEIAKLKQSQKQLAIEKLEKMREKFGYRYNSQLVISSKYLSDFIDNQIKELKGENNGI